jgi:hypothetical protein
MPRSPNGFDWMDLCNFGLLVIKIGYVSFLLCNIFIDMISKESCHRQVITSDKKTATWGHQKFIILFLIKLCQFKAAKLCCGVRTGFPEKTSPLIYTMSLLLYFVVSNSMPNYILFKC